MKAFAQQLRAGTKNLPDEEKEGKESPKVFFGLVEVPASFAHTYNLAYNFFQPRIRLLVEKGIKNYGQKAFGKHANAAAEIFGWTYTFGAPLAGGVNAYFTRMREFKDLAKTLSPVLEAMGKTATSGNLGVLASNEIYQVEKRRIGLSTKQHIMTDVVAESVASAQQAVWKLHEPKTEHEDVFKPRKGESPEDALERRIAFDEPRIREQERIQAAKTAMEEKLAKRLGVDLDKNHWEMTGAERRKREQIDEIIKQSYPTGKTKNDESLSDDAMRDIGSALGAGASEALRWSFLKDAKNSPLKETALDKITELCRDIDDKGAGSLSVDDLSQRIQDIFNIHQRNMGQSEVRQVDQENFESDCKQIAEAICNYDLDPMGLVLLAGAKGADNDRFIIKKQGKQVATFEETQAAIDKVSELMPASSSIDPHIYQRELAITPEKQKEILRQLPEGTLRNFYISELPQPVARGYGISDKDYIANKRSMRGSQDELLRLAITDLLVMPDEVLKEVFKEQDIEKLRKIGDDVLERGVVAVKESRSKGKPDGIEMLVLAFTPYWDKMAGGELKEIGALGSSLIEKYKEERAAKKEEGKSRDRDDDEHEERHAKRNGRGNRDKDERKDRDRDEMERDEGERSFDKRSKRKMAAELDEEGHDREGDDRPKTRLGAGSLERHLKTDRSEHASRALD